MATTSWVNCLICKREVPHSECVSLKLTEEERASIANPLDEYLYCKPCWAIMSDPNSAASLMSGIAALHLRNAGVPNADKLAADFKASLTLKALEKRS